ncbi:MAG: type II toxin-antitoxin system RelE/ParE family toxin [Chloroflexi bacterium]|nr:type II toxin-antitoxin system RelE/ParE family toxin [Chloroflexota bacterium]
MARVAWTPLARRDLQQIEDFISADSPDHGEEFVAALKSAVARLERFPLLGREAPVELHVPGLRQLLFHKYRIVYRLRGQTVEVHAIVHGAMDLEKIAQKRGWRSP